MSARSESKRSLHNQVACGGRWRVHRGGSGGGALAMKPRSPCPSELGRTDLRPETCGRMRTRANKANERLQVQ
eukprot:1992877-Rhodomonas_salina.1